MPDKVTFATIPDYIAAQSDEARPHLEQNYALIESLVPEGTQQRMSWGMPTFWWHGNLVHFAAQKHHMGLYPGASGVEHFAPQLAAYKTSKGAIQIPYSAPLPTKLIEEIVRFRIKENEADAKK